MKLSPYVVARGRCGVPAARESRRLARGANLRSLPTRRLRLARLFWDPRRPFWMNIQAQFDLECEADELAAVLKEDRAH